jgi:hypothetical protein
MSHWRSTGGGRISDTIRSLSTANRAGIRLLHAPAELEYDSLGIDDVRAKQGGQHNSDQTELGPAGITEVLTKNQTLTSIELDDNS